MRGSSGTRDLMRFSLLLSSSNNAKASKNNVPAGWRRSYATKFGYALARSLIYSKEGWPEEVLRLHSYSIPPAYGENITVRFLASPINPADINQIEGVYPAKPSFDTSLGTSEDAAVPGNEGLVQIVTCGSKVNPSIKPGQWAVMASSKFGTWRTYASAKESDLVIIKNKTGISAVQAATVSVNPCTAYRMLKDFTPLQPGDWFIQNGSNSGVGRFAIQLGKIWGLKSINVVRNRPDIKELKEELIRMGATEVLTEEEAKDKSLIKKLTRDEPVRLGLNCVCGESALTMAKILGNGGHLVTYGAMAKRPMTLPASLFIFKDLHCHGFWLTSWSEKHPGERARTIDEILNWTREGKFEELPIEVTEWSDETKLSTLMEAIRKGISGFSGKKSVFVMKHT